MAIKNPNGYGGVKKLPGNRRKPWAAVVTTGYTTGAKDISFLAPALGAELYKEVEEKYQEYMAGKMQAKQEKKYIGYYRTRQEAMMALAEFNRSPYDLDNQKITFGEIYNILYDEKFSKMKGSTKSTYTSSIQKCGSVLTMKVKDIRKTHLEDILRTNNHLSKSSQHNLLVLFHAIFAYALENDIVKKDYSKNLTTTSTKEEKEKMPFDRNEIKKLWENLHNYTMADAILVMIYTGVRVNELLGIRKEDVHLSKRYIEIWGTKTDAAERWVPIHTKIAEIVAQRLGEPGEYLFPNKNGGKMSYTSFRENNFDEIMDGLGMKHTPHETRHSFVTYATGCGMDRTILKKIVGHASADVTDRVYTHSKTLLDAMIREIEKLDI